MPEEHSWGKAIFEQSWDSVCILLAAREIREMKCLFQTEWACSCRLCTSPGPILSPSVCQQPFTYNLSRLSRFISLYLAAEQELGNTLTPLLICPPPALMVSLFQMMSLGHGNSFLIEVWNHYKWGKLIFAILPLGKKKPCRYLLRYL